MIGVSQLKPSTEVHRWKINQYVISKSIFWFSYVPDIMLCVEVDTFLINKGPCIFIVDTVSYLYTFEL